MAIRLLVTRGYGNGTFSGTIAALVLRGYQGLTVEPGTGEVVISASGKNAFAIATADQAWSVSSDGKNSVVVN